MRTSEATLAPASRGPHARGDLLDGRYRLVTRLGHGGFGDVWRAEELLPDGAPFREVALKLLIPGGGDEVDWAEEAKLLASFRHASLVTIFAAGLLAREGSAGADRFVAMELLEGQNLADLSRERGPVAWRRVLRWATSAAAALDVIHTAGVVHLDLKPANLFLCADGALKVLDFGIARRAGVEAVAARRGALLPDGASTSDAERATGLFIAARAGEETPRSHDEDAFAATRPLDATGHRGRREVVIGTPGFMAPEVLELGTPTAAADAYALAVCVVLLCTGHLPHMAPDEPATWDDPTEVSAWLDAIRRATLRGNLRPFDETPGALPRGLAALVRRLLAVDPKDRDVRPGGLAALFEEAWQRPHGVPDPPYFALRPYPAEAEGLLFGRDDDIARLGRELEYEPALVLQGAAGSGKSSLLAAGIVPHLAKRGVDSKDDWRAVPIVPTAAEEPDAALARALGALRPELRDADIDALAAFARAEPVGIALLLDPLEAVLRAGAHACVRLEALVNAIANQPARPGLRLVAAIGEDATRSLLASPLGPAVRAALRFVGAPATAAVTDLCAAPAHLAGVTVLAAAVVADDVQKELRAGSFRLPYVALALEEWWRGRDTKRNELHGERWRATGGIGGAVVRHADRVFRGLERDRRRLAEEVLLRLSATDGTLLRWDEGELRAALGAEGMLDETLAGLQRELVVRVTGAGAADRAFGAGAADRAFGAGAADRAFGAGAQGSTVEIAHAALLRDWPLLASARLANMERLAYAERVREARLAWERADNHGDFLLRGSLLSESRTRARDLEPTLGPADRAFLRESMRRARFRTAGRVGAAGVVLVALAGGIGMRQMIDQAREEEARAKAAAVELEQLAELAAKARRAEDPYYRATLVAAALVRGSTDGLLPLDLLAAGQNLVRASFLTLDRVDAPSFPWDDRFLVGATSTGAIAIFDFRPPEPDVIEDVDLDADPTDPESAHFKKPALVRLVPHEAPLVERVDFAFDTAFATRAANGEVKVFRVREDGRPALAAIAPMRCVGCLRAALAAPVLACGTEHGVARWDLRRRSAPEAVVTNPFQGDVADVSPDGERVSALADREVLFWAPGSDEETRRVAPRPVSTVRFAPRGHAAAILAGAEVEVVDVRRPATPLFVLEPDESRAASLRWDDGGLDLAVCGARDGRWYYLRKGGRAPGEAAPRGEACAGPPKTGPHAPPEPVATSDDAPELVDREMGPHLPTGGFRLHGHRYLTRDLVVLDPGYGHDAWAAPGSSRPAAARLLRFEAHDDIGIAEPREQDDSVAAVQRDGAEAMFQVGDEMRFYALPEGTRMFVRKGSFLRRCNDGRFLAWEADGPSYRIFDAWTGALIRALPRDPGFVVGAGGACRAVYTQRLDGTLIDNPLDGRPARELAKADGYVYDTRPSGAPGRADAGLLLAFSSGAMARIDDATHTVRVLGYATPRAHAIADGPHPGEIVFADAGGVGLLRPGAAPATLWPSDGVMEWTDLAPSPDGTSMLLTAHDRVAALDVARRELLGSMPVAGIDRMVRWDDEGSVLLWGFERRGGAEGVVVPRGVGLARMVAEGLANLEVERGKVVIRR
jgi:serine/threonine protein kinase